MDRQHIRILNLEDNPVDAGLIALELTGAALNFAITRVTTERAFRDALESSGHDVILAGYNLPDLEGEDALRIAHNLVPDIPFIFVSASLGAEQAVQALREGATDYIIKDRLSRLPSAITRALTEKRDRELHQRTQDALRHSEERFQYAAKATQEVILDWDLNTDRVGFNEAMKSVWGYDEPAGEVTAQWWAERIHPEDREATLASIQLALESEERWVGEFRFRRADGTYAHVLDRSIIVRNEAGKAQRMVCGMVDVTLQREAAARVHDSELRFRSVAETASDAIVLSDIHGKIVFWNAGAACLFGYDGSEALGESITSLMPERYRDAHTAGIRHYRETGQRRLAGQLLEFEGLRKDGSEFPLEMSLTVWTSGDETFCTAMMRDITQRVVHDRRQRAQFAVARTLAEASAVDDVTCRLLENIASNLQWPVGFCWVPEGDDGALRCIESWSAADFDGKAFLRLSKSLILHGGEDLPTLAAGRGRAVASDPRPIVSGEPSRASVAAGFGLPRSIAFPIAEHGEVVAVLEFFEARPAADDREFLNLLTDLGQRVGEFFERRRAEENLLQSETRLTEAQHLGKLGSFTFDARTSAITWSDQTYEIFGVHRDTFDVTGESYLAGIHPDDRELVRKWTTPPLRRYMNTFRHRVVRPSGEVRFVHCRVQVVSGTTESPEQMRGTVQDITEQVEAEETIQQLSDRNEMILNSAAEGILGVDLAGRVTFANPAASSLTQWSVEELMAAGELHPLIHHTRDDGTPYPRDECPLHKCLREGRPGSGMDTFWRRSGEAFPARFTCAPIFDGTTLTGAVLTFDDITAQARLQRQLEQANRVSALGHVAATIAHEFNNVLMGIQPFAEMIRRRAQDETIQKAAAQITTSVSRGKRVTQEILRFTQPAAPSLHAVPLGSWMPDLFAELRGLVPSRIELTLDMPPEPVTLRCDPAQIQQVLTNLVLNATDAIAANGIITIAVDGGSASRTYSFGPIPPGMASISVNDTGSGMAPDVLRHVFEPLFTTKRTGTGLGLAVAQQVIVRHGGSIHVDSAPGRGTTFHLLVPVEQAAIAPTVSEQQPKHRIRRVVLVEDEPIVAAGIGYMLEVEGIDSHLVGLGGLALQAIEDFNPDAVILDLSLPDMDGTDVYERIAANHPDLPLLISSGYAHETAMERFAGVGNVAVLGKPYDRGMLVEALGRIAPARSGAGDMSSSVRPDSEQEAENQSLVTLTTDS